MITAEKFYEQERLKGNTGDITGNPDPDYNNRFYSEIFELMIEFAKLHVEEALKQFLENAETEILCQHGYGIFDEDSILNAYPLILIK